MITRRVIFKRILEFILSNRLGNYLIFLLFSYYYLHYGQPNPPQDKIYPRSD